MKRDNRLQIKAKLEEMFIKILKLSADFDRNQNFLELGGQSILATQLQMNIYKEFKVKLKLVDFYKHGTVEDLTSFICSMNVKKDSFQKEKKSISENIPFELKDMQKAYLVGRNSEVELGGEATHAYCEIYCENYDHKRFVSAVRKLIATHDILRYKFSEDGTQCLSNLDFDVEVPFNNITNMDESSKREFLAQKREEIFNYRFDIHNPPLVYFEVTVTAGQNAIIHFCHDGLVVDGWSHENIVKDLDYYYCNPDSEIIQLKCNYKMYCEYLNDFKRTEDYKIDREFWIKWSENMPENPDIPLLREAREIKNVKTRQVMRKFSKKDYEVVKAYAKKNEISPFSILLTMYGKAIARCSKRQRFLLNVPMALRPPITDDIWNMVGECSNFMLFDFDNRKGESLLDTARRNNAYLLELLDHNQYSGIDFMGELQKKFGGNIIAPVVFTSTIDIPYRSSQSLIKMYSKTHTSQVWIDAVLMHCQENIIFIMDCVEDMISEDTGNFIADSFIEMLHMIVNEEESWSKNVSVPLDTLSKEVINKINDTEEELPKLTVGEILMDSFNKNSDKMAIGCEDISLTYQQALNYCRSISQSLQDVLKIHEKQHVGIMMKKGWMAAVAEIACVLTNHPFMPIESSLSVNNINACVKNAGLSCILTDDYYLEKIKQVNISEVINLNKSISQDCNGDFVNKAELTDICYIINTSGTTGVPKSIYIENHGLASCLLHTNKIFQINSQDRAIAVTNMCHDMSIFDVFGMLAAGGAVIIPSDDKQKDPVHWLELMNKYNVNIWNSVPAFMEMFIEAKLDIDMHLCNKMKVIFMGGDWVRVSLVKDVKQLFANSKVVSVGGPSETTLWNISHVITDEDIEMESIPYGTPFPNTKYYILNDNMELCPIGVEGTMYVSGIGVAREYAGLVEETQKRFIMWSGEKVYNTGDRGYYRKDRQIIFCGRKDLQVKINGKRIELTGIEKVIESLLGIDSCCVLYDNDRKILRAFYTSKAEISEQLLKQHMVENCPDYMVPEEIIYLKNMPLTVNGKINREKLLDIKQEKKLTENMHNGRKPLENDILDICKELFNRPNISYDDNFFLMGGNSILAIKLITIIRNKYNVSLSIYEIMNKPYISRWAEIIENKMKQEKKIKIENRVFEYQDSLELPLTYIQEEMWTYEMMKQDSRYVISSYIELDFLLNYDKLKQAVIQVVNANEVLRYRFRRNKIGLPYQEEFHNEDVNLQLITISDKKNTDNYMKLISNERMNLEEGPLYKFTLIQVDNKYSIFMITLHHLIADEQTYSIICNEMLDCYKTGLFNSSNTGYKDYIARKKSERLEMISQFDLDVFKNYDLNTFKIYNVTEQQPSMTQFTLSNEVMQQLECMGREYQVSVFDILLTGYSILFCNYFNQQKILISVPVSDRALGDYEKTAGLFLSKILIPITVDPKLSLIETILMTKGSLLKSYNQTTESFAQKIKEEGLESKVKQLHNGIIFNFINSNRNYEYSELKYVMNKEEHSMSDFQMLVEKREEGCICRVTSGSGCFSSSFLEFIAEKYKDLLAEIKNDIILNSPLEDLIEDVHCENEGCETLIQKFLSNVENYPDYCAINGFNGSLTYSEMFREVTRIAALFEKKGVSQGDVVAVFCSQKPQTITTIFAVLYVGAVYVPIEYSMTAERINYIIQDCNSKYFAVTENIQFDVNAEVVLTSEIDNDAQLIQPEMRCKSMDQIAYIIYTSGSTGNAKGVPITQRGIVNLCNWYMDEMQIKKDSRLILLNNFGFDGSVKTLFTAFVAGASLITVVDELYNIPVILKCINEFRVTHMAAVPSLLIEILKESSKTDYSGLISVIYTISGGESIMGAEFLRWRKHSNCRSKLINVYGPAEGACISTYHEIKDEELESNKIPIGKPIWNKDVYILNENDQLCKTNQPGTIWIAGEGIFEHYIGKNKEDSKLRRNIFSKKGFIFCTGDRGKWNDNQEIIFLGRIDNQIKVNGQRIEIEEIEAAFAKHSAVESCAYKVEGENNQKIHVMFYVTKDPDYIIDNKQARDFLRKYLSEGVIPQKFVKLSSIPLSRNGKCDRNALHLEAKENSINKNDLVKTKSKPDMIKKVSEAWKDTLGIEKVPINRGFFELGGTSLLYYRLQVSLENRLGIDVSINDILTYSTVEEMVNYLMLTVGN